MVLAFTDLQAIMKSRQVFIHAEPKRKDAFYMNESIAKMENAFIMAADTHALSKAYMNFHDHIKPIMTRYSNQKPQRLFEVQLKREGITNIPLDLYISISNAIITSTTYSDLDYSPSSWSVVVATTLMTS